MICYDLAVNSLVTYDSEHWIRLSITEKAIEVVVMNSDPRFFNNIELFLFYFLNFIA